MEVVIPTSEILGDPKQVLMNDQVSVNASTSDGLQQHQRLSITGQGSSILQVNGISANEGTVLLHTLPASKACEVVSYQEHGKICPGETFQIPGDPRLLFASPQASNFGRPLESPPGCHPPPLYSNRGPVAANEATSRFMPIASLNPYRSRWTIKARVTSKGEIRRFHNAKGEGKVFSFDLLDAEESEIRVTCFNNVADQFHDIIEAGSVYVISKGSLKPAQRSFNHLKNDWEILLENSSIVERCTDEHGLIPHQQFDFRPISEVENLEGNAMVDIMGVVEKINPTTRIMRKTGTEVQKRTLHLRDSSNCSVEVTLWGGFCNSKGEQLQKMLDSGLSPVLAVKGSRVSDFGGKSVGTVSSSKLLINPNLPQALEIKSWFEQTGRNTAAQPISKESGNVPRVGMRKTVCQIKDEGLGRSDKPDWTALRGTVSFIKTDNFSYTACPLPLGDRQCNKKVINNGDGTWRCDRCDKAVVECDYRYLLSVQVQDHTGALWITAFQEAGEEITGASAKDFYTWKEDESPKFKDTVQKLLFKQYLFKLKVKEENYNDEMRVKCTAIKTEKLDHAAENKVLVNVIRKLARGEPMDGSVSTLQGTRASSFLNCSSSGERGQSVSFRGGNIAGTSSFSQARTGYNIGCGRAHLGKDGSNRNTMNHIMAHCGGSFSGFLGYANGSVEHANGGLHGLVRYENGGVNGPVESANACFKCGQGGHWARDCHAQGATCRSFADQLSYGGYRKGF